MPRLTRRHFSLGLLGSTLAAFATGAQSLARRRFLFLHAEGGWDPLCAFAPMFDAPAIAMEAEADVRQIGAFKIVDGPGRPSVAAFFERHGDRTLLINGLSTRSVNHETCQAVALTGSGGDDRADWATLIAAAAADDYFLPHLVMNGPSFKGPHAVVVSQAAGLLKSAVDGSVVERADMPLVAPSLRSRALVDEQLASSAAAHASPSDPLSVAYAHALARSRSLTEIGDRLVLPSATSFRAQALGALSLLADGVTRCASVSTDFVWDSHIDNTEQTPLFEQLFADLGAILDALPTLATVDGATLADDTVVVVLSEMARTPAFNGTGGRDHWPYTSALVIGPGITGGRTVGAFDDHYVGVGVDPASGELDASRLGIEARSLGATLLALADVDPARDLPDVDVLRGVLS